MDWRSEEGLFHEAKFCHMGQPFYPMLMVAKIPAS